MNKEKLIQLKNEIVFVTTNKGKIASAKEKLQDIKIDICNYEVEEIRSDDVKEIAKHSRKALYFSRCRLLYRSIKWISKSLCKLCIRYNRNRRNIKING